MVRLAHPQDTCTAIPDSERLMNSSYHSAWQDFCALAVGTDGEGKGLPCGKSSRHLLVKGAQGEPVLFLNSAARTKPRAPIRLRNVVGEFDRRYALQADANSESSGYFTTLRCLPEAAHLHPFFVEMAVATANTQPNVLSEGQVDALVEGLIDVFRPGKIPVPSTIVGLWGELAVLAGADDIDAWVAAWHDTTTDAFDFCFKDNRIEVKSTEKPLREHEFSVAQVSEARTGDFIASVQLKRSAGGQTAIQLANEIASRLAEGSRAKFWSLIYATLDKDAASMDNARFDLAAARQSVVFIPSRKIPCVVIPAEFSALVSHVRYQANVGTVAQQHGLRSIEFQTVAGDGGRSD